MSRFLFLFCLSFIFFSQGLYSAENKDQKAVRSEVKTKGAVRLASRELSASSKDEFNRVEKIKVTGSRIKRIDLEGPSPVTVITKEEMDNSGYLSTSEFLTESSLSNFGSTLIHNRSTLTLVNGSRLVYGGAIDFIPTESIERIEILRDGSSALYGSDVVGGVINIITKKDIPRPSFSLKLAPSLYPLYKRGSQAEASFAFGEKLGRGHFISTFEFQYQDRIDILERRKWINEIFLEGFAPYARFITKGGVIVDPNCPAGRRDKDRCKYDIVPHIKTPGGYKLSFYNFMERPLFGETSFYGQLFGFWNHAVESQPIFGQLELKADHKMSQGQKSPGALHHLFGSSYEDLHISDRLSDNIYLDSLLGLKGYLSNTWDWDWQFKWSNIWKKQTFADFFYEEDLLKAFTEGVYDPFNPAKRDLSSVRRHNAKHRDHDLKLFSSLDFSGETPFWNMDMALGLQAYYNRYKNTPDPEVVEGSIFALKAVDTKLRERHVTAGYMEMVKHFSDVLEVQAAGRVDHYSDFGWTFNPKLAFRFQPRSNFLIRSSVGTSFEAPTLSQLYTPRTTGYVSIFDTVACYNELKAKKHFQPIYTANIGEGFDTEPAKDKLIMEFLIEQSSVVENENISPEGRELFKGLANELGFQEFCRENSIDGFVVGNEELKETRAKTTSLGFHWQLNEDHNLTVDYWWNSLSGSPMSSFETKKTVDAEMRYGKEYVEERGVQYERDESHPYKKIKNPLSRPINIAGRNLSGLDLKWDSDFPDWNFYGGHFYLTNDFAYVLKSGVETFPGMGFINNLGKFTLPKWRNFFTLGWRGAEHALSLTLKSVAGVKKDNNEFERLPMGHILDFFYQYQYSPKTTLKFGWYNLLFSDPVLDDSRKEGVKYNGAFFNAIGPHFFVELRKIL